MSKLRRWWHRQWGIDLTNLDGWEDLGYVERPDPLALAQLSPEIAAFVRPGALQAHQADAAVTRAPVTRFPRHRAVPTRRRTGPRRLYPMHRAPGPVDIRGGIERRPCDGDD